MESDSIKHTISAPCKLFRVNSLTEITGFSLYVKYIC